MTGTVPVDQILRAGVQRLGVFVRAARESVNRQLQLWRKDGILDLQRGRILLLNMTKLTAVARND
jgi:CRP/FNR family transcriptional regulator, cyclic AMP receptor protein